mgnify:FL=1
MKVYNTLTQRKEDFKTINKNQALIYVCGPTVYDNIHIGNARPLIVFDTFRRYLMYKGFDVKYVVNFTDIDDKIIKRANDENVNISEITERYIKAFNEVAKGLNLYEEKTIHPRATNYIDQIIDFINGLVKKEAAYDAEDAVYFDIKKAKDYGKLSHKNIEDLKAGARIHVNEHKNSAMDFALWKKKKEENEPAWDSPWGEGRPGWHIECSTMAKSILGDTIDVHGGGADLEFPHHENEIAQSETLTGEPFANYWMHNAMITVNKEKMAKSKGNFFTLKDIEKKYDLLIIRYWLLSSHYRSPIDFSVEVIEQSKNAYDRLVNAYDRLMRLSENNSGDLREEEKIVLDNLDDIKKEFEKKMDDDLNTADAITCLFDITKEVNSNVDEDSSKELVDKSLNLFLELSDVLGFIYKKDEVLDDKIEELIENREKARANKNYALADEIRDELKEMGITLKDTRQGVVWTKE